MILYSVNIKAPVTNDEWSIITIHKSLEGAKKAKELYNKRWEDSDYEDWELKIIEIDTDSDSDIIYDYDS